MSAEVWWKDALFYRVESSNTPRDGLQGLAQRLDAVRALGVDALWIDPFQASAATLEALDPAIGSLTDIDDLIAAASRQKLRVILDLPSSATPENTRSIARFWLTHGAAGLYLKGKSNDAAVLQDLRRTESTFAGQRILIADAGGSQTDHAKGPDLRFMSLIPSDAELTGTALRSALDKLEGVQTDDQAGMRLLSLHPGAAATEDQPLAACLATLLMTARGSITLFAGQEAPREAAAGPMLVNSGQIVLPSLYREFSAMRRGNRAIRLGDLARLNPDTPEGSNALVWLRRPSMRNGAASDLIACNLSDHPVRLSLTSELTRLNSRGRWMRTLFRSYPGSGPEEVGGFAVPAFGVYIGELHN